MIACLSPSDLNIEENISTLTYAAKTAEIINEPTRNDDPSFKIIEEQKEHIFQLESEMQAANEHINFLTSLIQQKFKENGENIQIPNYKTNQGMNKSNISKIVNNSNNFIENENNRILNTDSPINKLLEGVSFN